jgi:hypothetical protein
MANCRLSDFVGPHKPKDQCQQAAQNAGDDNPRSEQTGSNQRGDGNPNWTAPQPSSFHGSVPPCLPAPGESVGHSISEKTANFNDHSEANNQDPAPGAHFAKLDNLNRRWLKSIRTNAVERSHVGSTDLNSPVLAGAKPALHFPSILPVLEGRVAQLAEQLTLNQ